MFFFRLVWDFLIFFIEFFKLLVNFFRLLILVCIFLMWLYNVVKFEFILLIFDILVLSFLIWIISWFIYVGCVVFECVGGGVFLNVLICLLLVFFFVLVDLVFGFGVELFEDNCFLLFLLFFDIMGYV